MGKKFISKPALCVSCRICEMSCSLEKTGTFNPVKAMPCTNVRWVKKNRTMIGNVTSVVQAISNPQRLPYALTYC